MIGYLAWTVVVMCAAMILLLVLPVRVFLKVTAGTDTGFRASARVMPCAGLFGAGGEYSRGNMIVTAHLGTWTVMSLDAGRFTRGRKKRKAEKPVEKAEIPPSEDTTEPLSDRIGRWSAKAREYRYYTGAGLRTLKAIIRIDGWTARVRFGLGDPGLTGQLAGFVYALNGALPERFTIVPEWDFTSKTCAGDADAVFTIRMHMVWVALVREVRAYLSHRGEWTVRPVKTAGPLEA